MIEQVEPSQAPRNTRTNYLRSNASSFHIVNVNLYGLCNNNNFWFVFREAPGRIYGEYIEECHPNITCFEYLEESVVDDKRFPFTFKEESNFRRHKIESQTYTELFIFTCQQCSHIAKMESHLKEQEVLHKSLDVVSLLKCEHCSYKSSEKVPLLKCEDCCYVTKQKSHLKTHGSIQKSFVEVSTFNCQQCQHAIKSKTDLKRHELAHKCSDEVPIFKCQQCSYVTKKKSNLKRHEIVHNNLTIFKCELCSYQTKHSRYLKRHRKVHMN